MSYVQGTVVLVTGTFRDPDTKALFDPPDVVATVKSETTTTHLRFTDDEITRLGVGAYRFSIDTSPESGGWRYELGSLGPFAVAYQRAFQVRPKLT